MDDKTKLSQERIDQLDSQQISVMNVIFALCQAKTNAEDFIRLKNGEEPFADDSKHLYEAGIKNLAEKFKKEGRGFDWNEAIAAMTESAFIATFCGHLHVYAEEMVEIYNHVMAIELENKIDNAKTEVKTSGSVH